MPRRPALLLSLWSCAAFAAKPGEFLLLPDRAACPCQEAGPACGQRVLIREMWQGPALQRHYLDRDTGRELFSVQTADQSGRLPWSYQVKGLCAYGDFNGDGLTDYSWFGQDGPQRDLFLFLSQPGGSYRRFDLIRTFEHALARKDKSHLAPDLHSGFDIVKPTLVRRGGRLRLHLGFGVDLPGIRWLTIDEPDWLEPEAPVPAPVAWPAPELSAAPPPRE